jgi:hypothetical protein
MEKDGGDAGRVERLKKKDLEEERVLLKGKVSAVKALVEAGIFRAMRAEGHDDIKLVIVTKIPPV